MENDGIEELKKKVQDLEQKINSGNIKISTNNVEQKPQNNVKNVGAGPVSAGSTKPRANVQNLTSEQYWPKVLDNLKTTGKMVLYSNLVNTKAKQKDDLTVEVIFPNGLTPFGKSLLERSENISELTKLVSMESGKEMRIKYIDAKEYVPKQEDTIENMAKNFDIPFNIIEE